MVFQKGQIAWNKGIKFTDKDKERNPFWLNSPFTKKGYKKSDNHKEKIGIANSISLKDKKHTKTHSKNISNALKGRDFSKKHKKNLSKSATGRKMSKISIQKNREYRQFWWKEKDEDYKKEHLKKMLNGLLKRPTSFEKKIILLCSKHKLPFIYTGDGRVLIGYKNPDFVDEENKIIIEVFLNYFKERDYGSVENYIKKRGEYFAKKGYKTIFIREEEIIDKNWEQICLNKLKDSGCVTQPKVSMIKNVLSR